MSAVTTAACTDLSCSDEYGMHHLTGELMLEICSNLEVHDQLAMKRVWVSKLWQTNLSQKYLSGYVHLDVPKLLGESEDQDKNHDKPLSIKLYRHRLRQVSSDQLEQGLNMHLAKNTKVLVLRHMAWEEKNFRIVAHVLRQIYGSLTTQTHLRRLLLMDCVEQGDFATVVNRRMGWPFPDRERHTSLEYARNPFRSGLAWLGSRWVRVMSISCHYLDDTACAKWSAPEQTLTALSGVGVGATPSQESSDPPNNRPTVEASPDLVV